MKSHQKGRKHTRKAVNSKNVVVQPFNEHDTCGISYYRNLFRPICPDHLQNQEKNWCCQTNHSITVMNPDTFGSRAKSEQHSCQYPTNDTMPDMAGDEHLDSNSFSAQFGCTSSYSTLLSIIVIIPEDNFSMKELCDSVMLSLSQHFIFCQISVYRKDEYIFALSNTYCDLCIVYKELLNMVSLSFPTVCCASYSYVPLSVCDSRYIDN